jgi:hypothetical protein
LKDHPRNYQQHPEDQVSHIRGSLRKHGFWKNVVIAEDGTILAGHGLVKSARAEGRTTVPVIRKMIAPDSPEALEIMTGDNEMARLAERDDRALTELLRDIRESEPSHDLIGTGFDDAMFANLVMVTRPKDEIATFNEAAEWIGMPGYETDGDEQDSIRLIVHFRNPEDRAEFLTKVGLELSENARTTWYPAKSGKDDVNNLRFEQGDEEPYSDESELFADLAEIPE